MNKEHNRMIDDVLVSLKWVVNKVDIIGSPDRNAWSLRMRKQIEFIKGLKENEDDN
jgi:hypothetical protein